MHSVQKGKHAVPGQTGSGSAISVQIPLSGMDRRPSVVDVILQVLNADSDSDTDTHTKMRTKTQPISTTGPLDLENHLYGEEHQGPDD